MTSFVDTKRKFENVDKAFTKHDTKEASYSVSDKLFQIETHNRPGHKDQVIQFDIEGLEDLINIIEKNYPTVFKDKVCDRNNKFDNDMGLENIILYGPPGTGKTHKMQTEYINKFKADDRFVTTFYQSFSYEEFVEGLKPVLKKNAHDDNAGLNDVGYTIEKGVFIERVKEQPCWQVMNR